MIHLLHLGLTERLSSGEFKTDKERKSKNLP